MGFPSSRPWWLTGRDYVPLHCTWLSSPPPHPTRSQWSRAKPTALCPLESRSLWCSVTMNEARG